MKVSTQYVGATDTKGSRIVAKLDGKQATAPYDYTLSALDNHATVAASLVRRVLPSAGPEDVTGVEESEKGYRWTLATV